MEPIATEPAAAPATAIETSGIISAEVEGSKKAVNAPAEAELPAETNVDPTVAESSSAAAFSVKAEPEAEVPKDV